MLKIKSSKCNQYLYELFSKSCNTLHDRDINVTPNLKSCYYKEIKTKAWELLKVKLVNNAYGV
ncbi:hypothetical protein [Borreliella lusitaniae]|uniref:hypothetical protein n=1 Tax=Borreliella lusitaniae TaxID=100177 RepID=UPI003AB2978F